MSYHKFSIAFKNKKPVRARTGFLTLFFGLCALAAQERPVSAYLGKAARGAHAWYGPGGRRSSE